MRILEAVLLFVVSIMCIHSCYTCLQMHDSVFDYCPMVLDTLSTNELQQPTNKISTEALMESYQKVIDTSECLINYFQNIDTSNNDNHRKDKRYAFNVLYNTVHREVFKHAFGIAPRTTLWSESPLSSNYINQTGVCNYHKHNPFFSLFLFGHMHRIVHVLIHTHIIHCH